MRSKRRYTVLATGVLTLLFCGLIYGWSIFVVPLEAEFGWQRTETSLTFTISIICYVLGNVSAGVLAKRIKPAILLRIAAALLLLGFGLASLVQELYQFYLAYGVCCGLGVGMCYNALMSTVNRWFPDKPGLISGILLMGFGCGGLALGSAAALLMQSMGWRPTFRVFAFGFFTIIAMTSLFIKMPKPSDLASLPASCNSDPDSGRDISTKDMLKRKGFLLYYLWASLLPVAALVMVGNAAPVALELGATAALSTLAAGTFSVANGLGRVLLGAVYDWRGHRVSILLCSGLELLSVLLLYAAYQAAGTAAFVLCLLSLLCMGLSFGGNPTVNSAFLLEFYGRGSYSVNLSVTCTTLLAASFVGPAAAASIMTATGSYAGCIPFLLVFSVITFIPGLLVKRG